MQAVIGAETTAAIHHGAIEFFMPSPIAETPYLSPRARSPMMTASGTISSLAPTGCATQLPIPIASKPSGAARTYGVAYGSCLTVSRDGFSVLYPASSLHWLHIRLMFLSRPRLTSRMDIAPGNGISVKRCAFATMSSLVASLCR